MRVLIVEEALRGPKGHWPSYIGDIARGLRAAGDEVDVLVHAEAVDEVIRCVDGIRKLSRSCWDDPRSRGAFGGCYHNFLHWTEVCEFLDERPPYDWILALTMRTQHILAYAALARRSARGGPRLLLLFVQGQGQYVGPGRPSEFPMGMSSRLMRFGLHLLREHVAGGRVVLAAETLAMKGEYERFVGLPFRLFPHPVQLGRMAMTAANGENPNSLTFICPGFARHEKGSDLLQEAILELIRESPDLAARFVLQWLGPFRGSDGSEVSLSPELAAHPKVQVINDVVAHDRYAALMNDAHAVILPYRADSYHARVSRVAIEAAALGKPLIVTGGTWPEELYGRCAAGLTFRNEDVASLCDAIRRMAGEYPRLLREARDRAPEAIRYFSVETFRNTMLVLPAA